MKIVVGYAWPVRLKDGGLYTKADCIRVYADARRGDTASGPRYVTTESELYRILGDNKLTDAIKASKAYVPILEKAARRIRESGGQK